MPDRDSKPDDELLDVVDRYRAEISEFAARYLLGAVWSARAVHDAVRLHRAIQLPPAPPRPPRQVLARIKLDLEPEEPLSEEMVALLREVLEDPKEHPSVAEYRRERDGRNEEIAERLERRPEYKHLARDYRRLQGLYAEAEANDENKPLEPNRRDAMWEGAIEFVAFRLQEEKALRSTPSSAASRAKRYLNAAVNGAFDSPIPAELCDAPNYFTELRPLLFNAVKAIRVARGLERQPG